MRIYRDYKVYDIIEIVSTDYGTTSGANVQIGDQYDVNKVDSFADVVCLDSLLGDVWVDMEDIKLVSRGLVTPAEKLNEGAVQEAEEPDVDFIRLLDSFDTIDLDSLTNKQLTAYLKVAYENHVYAEAVIDKREQQRRRNK